jgi:hypothetical protein
MSRCLHRLMSFALAIILLVSCTTGPPMPKPLRQFTEVDILSPDVKWVRILRIIVTTGEVRLTESEMGHIRGRLAVVSREALREAGFKPVTNYEDAVMILEYQMHGGRGSKRLVATGAAGFRFAIVDMGLKEVFYRSMSFYPRGKYSSNVEAFDAGEVQIKEYMDRVLFQGEWQ